MFQWLKSRVVQWVERCRRRQIDALLAEAHSLKAQLLELNGGRPARLSPDERARLEAKRERIDPERLKEIDVLDMDAENPPNGCG